MPVLSPHPSPGALAARSRRARLRQARIESGWRDGRYRDPAAAPVPPHLVVQRWRLAHRDAARLMDRIYKGMKRNALYTEHWPRILAHYGGRCLKCGSIERVSADSVRPVRADPEINNVLANLQPLCRSCGAFKRNRAEDYRPDGGAWITQTIPEANTVLHPTKRRARYGSNGWALTAGNCQSRRNCHQKLSPAAESAES